MATEHINMGKDHFELLEEANVVFVVIFTIEMALKLIGLGLKEYCKSFQNIFDGTLVLVSMLEILLSAYSLGNLRSIVVLRGFRVFRVLKLAKSWDSLNSLLWTVMYSLRDISNLAIIFFLWVFCSTMLAAALFANKIKFNENDELDLKEGVSPRLNYDTMGSAFTTIFTVVEGGDW